MTLGLAKLGRVVPRHVPRSLLLEIRRSSIGIALTLCIAITAYMVHLNLASAISVLLLVTVIVATHWGFLQATLVSLTAVGCLDFFFTPPLLQFTVLTSENWVALATFEATALLVGRLSWKVKLQAQEQEQQRQGISKLYELSNAILLVDGRTSNLEQLSALMREFFHVQSVDLWAVHEGISALPPRGFGSDADSACQAYVEGIDSDSIEGRWSRRMLRLGTSPIGAMVLQGWEVDASLADAAASLIAVALERARSVQKENRAEAARNTEQLRTAVLDALAHGFKTPLTAIQTASSGLLAIGHLDEAQTELVEIVDHEVAMLGRLTTRLLQTAALDAKEIRVRSSMFSLARIVKNIASEQDAVTRERIEIVEPIPLDEVTADAQLLELALTQLIDNASKYSGIATEITVTLTQDEAKTQIIVSNQGSLIVPEDLKRIFERYYRGSLAISGPTGTGLGLSIAKKIAEAHGGTITAECDEDIIRFTLSIMGGRRGTDG